MWDIYLFVEIVVVYDYGCCCLYVGKFIEMEFDECLFLLFVRGWCDIRRRVSFCVGYCYCCFGWFKG